ncbi:hypothetical protein LEMLEM_LOCUS5218, partial [Lemmus lemmus]
MLDRPLQKFMSANTQESTHYRRLWTPCFPKPLLCLVCALDSSKPQAEPQA